MTAPARRRGQIGDYWLTKNRHGVWSRTWWDPARRHVRAESLGTRDYDEAVLRLAEVVTLIQLEGRSDPEADAARRALEARVAEYGRHRE